MRDTEIATLLPSIFQRTLGTGNPMSAMLSAMQALHAPAEEALENVDAIYDPRRAPDPFVPMLAQWVDLEHIFSSVDDADRLLSTGLGNLRELTQAASELSKWRGTRRGLQRFLETATGVTGFSIEEPADRAFHLRVLAPPQTQAHRPLIERIIEVERPAYATWELQFVTPG